MRNLFVFLFACGSLKFTQSSSVESIIDSLDKMTASESMSSISDSSVHSHVKEPAADARDSFQEVDLQLTTRILSHLFPTNKIARPFDLLINQYFEKNFGQSGKDYLQMFQSNAWKNQVTHELTDNIRNQMLIAAQKILDKYNGKGSFWGTRKSNEISFRLHRVIGAFQFILLRDFDRDRLGKTRPPFLVSRVMQGANASMSMMSTFSMRETIKKVSEMNDGVPKLTLIDLIGKIAWSGKAKPKFLGNLFKMIDFLVKADSSKSLGIIEPLNSLVDSSTSIEEIEESMSRILTNKLAEIKR